MSNAGGLDKQSLIALNLLCASIKHDIEIRRADTEERIALAKKRNLEWELGLKGSASDLAGYSPKHYTTLPSSRPTKKSSRSRTLEIVRDHIWRNGSGANQVLNVCHWCTVFGKTHAIFAGGVHALVR